MKSKQSICPRNASQRRCFGIPRALLVLILGLAAPGATLLADSESGIGLQVDYTLPQSLTDLRQGALPSPPPESEREALVTLALTVDHNFHLPDVAPSAGQLVASSALTRQTAEFNSGKF